MALCSSPVSHILRKFDTSIIDDLARENYTNWSICIKSYLLSQDLWEAIEVSSEPKPEELRAYFKIWGKKNAAALLAIQNSCEPDILSHIREITSAKVAWDTLAKRYQPEPPTVSNSSLSAINPGDLANRQQQLAAANQGVHNNEYRNFRPLYNAIKKGDWDDVKIFIERNPDVVKAKITPFGRTPLHVACHAGHLKIVEKLVQFMSEEDLAIQNQFGNTVLVSVAMAGFTRIAECMIKKNKYLACIKNNQGHLPVNVATMCGHKDMTCYLYSVTPIDLLLPEKGMQGTDLLICSIYGKMYDVSLDLVRRCPSLATAISSVRTIPLVELASMPFAFPSGSRLTFWQRWIYSCIHLPLPTASSEVRVYIPQNGQSERHNIIQLPVLGQLHGLVSNLLKLIGMKEIYDMKCTHLHALEILHCMFREESISNLTIHNYATFEATKRGILEFIIEMSKVNPDLLYLQTNSRHIFMVAIVHRQEMILSLLYGLDTWKNECVGVMDKSNNNMLHLAGMLAPNSQLARISGAALQMQRELQWFKEVKSIVPRMSQEHLNEDLKTPRQVFTECHKDLRTEGEKWMKETATSYTVVGALIITIMFAAAFTVPGGNDQNTGFPIFLHKKSFMVFIISDAISLFASSTSVLMFLGILASRYAEDDFLKSLPTKLIIGLFNLFFSIAAMIVAFSAALFIMLQQTGMFWISIPILLIASVPVTLFVLLQFPLLVEIFMSTYGPSIFDRKMKPWL